MIYTFVSYTAMILHFMFLAFVFFGGFLAWIWPKAFWLHLPVAAYALGIVTIGWECFLTHIENWGRVGMGEEPLDRTFINHYLTGNLYPEDHVLTSRIVTGIVVGIAYIGLLVIILRRRRRRAEQQEVG